MPIKQVQPTTAPTVIYTVPTRRTSSVVYISVTNPSVATASWFKAYAVPNGEVVAVGHIFVPQTTLDATQSYQWFGDLRLVEGDTIQVEAEVTLTLSVTVSHEETPLIVRR